MGPAEAWLMVDMMKGVVQRGTAAGSVWGAGFRVPSGGKTGTTNDGADVWYVGYTADLVAGVWMGFDRPRKIMANAQGGRLAAPAFTQFMLEAYRRKPVPPDWPRPAGIVYATACSPEGTYGEYFVAGTEYGACGLNPFTITPQQDTAAALKPTAAPAAKVPAKPRADSTNPFKIP
jgi:penicillin-binding protein 1A